MTFTERNVEFDSARVVILPLEYGETGSFRRGAEKGPYAILSASEELELYDEETGRVLADVGIHTLSPPKLPLSPELMIEEVYRLTKELLKDNKRVVSLGGDHTVTIGIVKAFKEHFGNLNILVLDAHSDMRDEYEGSRFSHACTSRRLLELGRVRIVGVRSLSKDEAEDRTSDIVYMRNIIGKEIWIDNIIAGLSQNIYLSIDLDVLDSGIMPSVQTPEPGGFGWYEILTLLETLTRKKNILGFDMVELSPIAGNPAPDFLAAKLVYKMIGYLGETGGQGDRGTRGQGDGETGR